MSIRKFNFFNVNPQFFNKIGKFTSQIAWIETFTTLLMFIRELLDLKIIANAKILKKMFFLLNISGVNEIRIFFYYYSHH